MADYKQQAISEYDPQYNAKVQALKNQVAQQSLNLDQSKTGINQNYDTRVADQNLMNKKQLNSISNVALGRGFSRGTIVGSNLAEQNGINARQVGQIEAQRTGDLNNIDAQKALIANNMQSTLGQMAGDRQSEIAALARQLEDRDRQYGIQRSQLDLQRQAQELARQNSANEQAYRMQQLSMQRAQNSGAMTEYQRAMLQLERDKFNASKGANAEESNTVASNHMNMENVWQSNQYSDSEKANIFKNAYDLYSKSNNSDYKAMADLAKQYLAKSLASQDLTLRQQYAPTGGSGRPYMMGY